MDIKYEIIQKYLNDMRPIDNEKLFELSSSTVATIIKNKEKIIKEFQSNLETNSCKRNKLTVKIKAPKYEDLGSAVDSWFSQTINNSNVAIGGN